MLDKIYVDIHNRYNSMSIHQRDADRNPIEKKIT